MGIFTTCVFAQEVRGIETRRAIYEGESYTLGYMYYGRYRDSWNEFGNSTEYYGFEFTNLNSIPVSVTIEVYAKGNTDKMIDTKEIVLKSKEKYIHKYPQLKRYQDHYNNGTGSNVCSDSDEDKWKKCKEEGESYANGYYVKYKAFKLQ